MNTEPQDTKPDSEPVPTPAPTTRGIGTGLGCLALAVICCFVMFSGLAYGTKHANNDGQTVFQSALIGAPIVALFLGACWVAFRHRGPK